MDRRTVISISLRGDAAAPEVWRATFDRLALTRTAVIEAGSLA